MLVRNLLPIFILDTWLFTFELVLLFCWRGEYIFDTWYVNYVVYLL